MSQSTRLSPNDPPKLLSSERRGAGGGIVSVETAPVKGKGKSTQDVVELDKAAEIVLRSLQSHNNLSGDPTTSELSLLLVKAAQHILTTLQSHNNLCGHHVFHTTSDISLLLATLPVETQLHLPLPVIKPLLSHLLSVSLVASDPSDPTRYSSTAAIVRTPLPLPYRPPGESKKKEREETLEKGSAVRAGLTSNVGASTSAVRVPALSHEGGRGALVPLKPAPVKTKAPPKKKLKTVEEDSVGKPAKPAKGKKASKMVAPESFVLNATASTSKRLLDSKNIAMEPMTAQELQELDETANRILKTLQSDNNLHGHQVFHTTFDLSLMLATLPIDIQLHLPATVIDVLLSHLSCLSLVASDPSDPTRYSSIAPIVPTPLPLSYRPLDEVMLHLMLKFPSFARRFSELGIELEKKGVDSWVLAYGTSERLVELGFEKELVESVRQEVVGVTGKGLEGIDVEGLARMLPAGESEENEKGGVELDREWFVARHEELYTPMIRDLHTLLLRLSSIFGSSIYSEMANVVEWEALSTDFVVPPECVAGAFRTVAKWLACSGRLTREALNLLRGVRAITSLDLTRSFRSLDALEAANSLATLGMPCSFTSLATLNLSYIDLSAPHVLFSFHCLTLAKLDLTDTHTTSGSFEFISILGYPKPPQSFSPLQRCLKHLCLADNAELDDAALLPLLFLPELVTLDLTGTSISLRGTPSYTGGLHFYVLKAAHLQPSLTAVAPPSSVRIELSKIVIREIDHPMIANPDLVKTLTNPKLKENLRYQSKRVLLRGNKTDLGKRLAFILQDRLDNIVLLRRMGPKEVARVEEVWE